MDLTDKPEHSERRIIAVLNHKGGAGKTVLTTELGAILAMRGEKVLLIDLDPQRNLTLRLGYYRAGEEQAKPANTLYDVLSDPAEYRLSTAIVPHHSIDNLYLVPGRPELVELEGQLRAGDMADVRLSDALEDLFDFDRQEFDWVLIDCPPGLGIYTTNALLAANEVMAPVDLRTLDSITGLSELTKKIQNLGRRGPSGGMFLVGNMYDEVGMDEEDNREGLLRLGYPVARTTIKTRKAISKAHNRNQPLAERAIRDKGGRKAYKNLNSLADELLSGKLRGKPVEPRQTWKDEVKVAA